MAEPRIDMADCIRYLALDYPITGTSVNAVCPQCGSSHRPGKKKLNIDFRKNVFRCNRCGWQGGVYDFWAFHRGLAGTAEAARDIEEYLGGSPGARRTVHRQQRNIPERIDCETAPPEQIAEVYGRFLDLLLLNDADRANLRDRGLSDEAIERGGYRSFPTTNVETFCAYLMEQGMVLEGVPGFYRNEEGIWTFRRMSDGFLIPTRDISGTIQGMQLRISGKTSGTRYFTVSSAEMKSGAKGRALPHFNPGDGVMDTVILTEGPLKGNIISEFTGLPVIAVLGVNTLGSLPGMLTELRAMGMNRILLAYDMDRFSNRFVLEAQDKLKGMLSDMGIPYGELIWDENQKGLDDYIASLRAV